MTSRSFGGHLSQFLFELLFQSRWDDFVLVDVDDERMGWISVGEGEEYFDAGVGSAFVGGADEVGCGSDDLYGGDESLRFGYFGGDAAW